MNGLSSKELINRLWLESTDPTVHRLVEILQEESLVDQLVEVGMDPVTREFKDDGWEYRNPAEYIEHLRNDIDFYVRERDELQDEVYALQKEVTRLSTVSLVKFIADVQQTLETSKMEEGRARRQAEHDRKLREEAEQKFEFWEKLHYGIK